MTERTTVTQVVQLGTESTPGTPVTATKILPSLSIDGAIKTNIDKYRPLGNKFPTIHALGKEWTEAAISGEATYSEVHYLLASLLSYAAPVQVGGTTAYTWTHAPSSTAEDTVKTYTVERGSSVRADKFAYGLVNALTLQGNRDDVSISGSMLGTALSDGITLSGGATSIEQIPMLPKEFDVYLDTTSGGLGGTKLTRVLRWEINLKRFSTLWVVDSSKASWVAHVETPVEAQIKLRVEADSNGMSLLTPTRDSTTRFVRIKGTSGQLAGTSTPYSFTWDAAVRVSDVGKFEDEDGVYAIEYSLGIVHDAGWGKALTVAVVNKQTAL
jgi:hypothetical protein